MKKRFLLLVVGVLATLTCLAGTTVTTHTVTFDFSTFDGLTTMGIAVPATGGRTYLDNNATFTLGDVTLTNTNSTTSSYKNSIYYYSGQQSYELYLNSGASLTFAVPSNCSLTAISFNATYANSLTDNGEWSGNATGKTFTAQGRTVYVFTVAVTYTKTVTTPDLTTVTGIGNFKHATPGTPVRLYLPDSYDARVLAVKHNANGTTDAYVRDNTGAMLMQGISPNRTMACNQHLAGWIDGQYATNSRGLPCFVPAAGLTNTTQLVIADPVTEAAVEPRSITADQYNNYLADWVTMSDVRVGSGNITVSNGLNMSNYQAPYSGALIDASAIVAGNGALYLVDQNGVTPITYVIDASQQFVSPPQNLAGVRVRLNRTFAEGAWTTFTLPFTTSDFTGDIMEYYGLAYGPTAAETGNAYDTGRMMFLPVGEMEAGLPYLVRASADIDGMIYDNVTLMSMAPIAVTYTVNDTRMGASEPYSFVGTFTPLTLAVNNANKVLADGAIIEWVNSTNNQLPGTSAYFVTPANQGLELDLQGMNDDIVTGVKGIVMDHAPRLKGIYNMMGMKMQLEWEQLPPGIYIVNGRKTIKR